MADNKPIHKGRILLRWVLVVGAIILCTGLGFWLASRRDALEAGPAQPRSMPGLGESIFFGAFGVFFLLAGSIAYLVVLSTHCFTFGFTQPVWRHLKGRLYVANMIVPTMAMLGVGFIA